MVILAFTATSCRIQGLPMVSGIVNMSSYIIFM